MRHQRNTGFTIIELLIATAVFSIVLLTISAAVIQIGRLYYKGITSARTQEVARSVMNDISQNIQFNKGIVVGTNQTALNNIADPSNQAVCIVSQHYSYKLGQQRTSSLHGLVVKPTPSGCGSERAQDLSGNIAGKELLGEKMRLSNLVVEPTVVSGSYKVTVRIVYGDDDLLCSSSLGAGGVVGADCSSTQSMTSTSIATARDLACKNIRSGTQFCAAAELSTIVERRMQ